MSEIPMPEPGGYEPTPTEKKRGCCGRTVMCIGVIAIVIIGVIVATVILGGLGPSGPSYESRQIEKYTMKILLSIPPILEVNLVFILMRWIQVFNLIYILK